MKLWVILVVLLAGISAMGHAQILSFDINETWAGDTAATKTLELRGGGTLKSMVVSAPTCDLLRYRIEDATTGYGLQTLTGITPGVISRTSLSGEFYGKLNLKVYMEPTSGTLSTTMRGQIFYEQ